MFPSFFRINFPESITESYFLQKNEISPPLEFSLKVKDWEIVYCNFSVKILEK